MFMLIYFAYVFEDNHIFLFRCLHRKIATSRTIKNWVTRTFKTIDNFYSSLKDVTPLTLRANVHCLKGSCDKTQSYIGRTKRHLAVRFHEHLSEKSGKCAIHEHISSCKDCD